MYGFHLIPIYNRAQFLDKTDPCRSMSRRQGRVRNGMPSGYNARDPFFGPCWRYACLPVLTLGMQCLEDTSLTMPPASIRLGRESAPQVQAVKGRPQGNPTPGLWRALSLSAIELYSVKMGKRRQIQILIHPLTRECATDAADGLPMLWTCHTATEALHRLCASSPGSAWAFLGLLGLEREYGFRWAL